MIKLTTSMKRNLALKEF